MSVTQLTPGERQDPRVAGQLGSHQPSHLNIIGRVPRYAPEAAHAQLSAVVCPTSRPLEQSCEGLRLASWIASTRGAQFVVLRSGAATKRPFPAELAATGDRPTIVIDLPKNAGLPLPDFRNSRHPVATRYRRSDLATKRNLPLLMGILAGWETVLFLDDDITTRRASQLGADHLPREVTLRFDDVLADFRHDQSLMAAGYVQEDFDDNSVVCHVRKFAGLPQDEFISGGAIVVRCHADVPFFPATYDEDWLFLFFVMMRDAHSSPSSAVKRIGSIHQAAYYPFQVVRARSEELGDVFAEGLYNLSDVFPSERADLARRPDYWLDVVHARKSMIAHMLTQFYDDYGPTEHQVINDVEGALRAALAIYPSDLRESAGLMSGYFQDLMVDLRTWTEHTDDWSQRLGSALSVDRLLAELKLDQHTTEVLNPGEPWLPKPRKSVS